MSHTPVNSPCRKQRKISTRSPKTPLKKVQKSSRDNCCLICGINKLSGQGSFFNTTTTAGLKENLTVLLGESPDFSLSSRRVCKCCKRKVDSVLKRTLILEQDKHFSSTSIGKIILEARGNALEKPPNSHRRGTNGCARKVRWL